MPRHECPGLRMKLYGNDYVHDREDEHVIRNLKDLNWYSHTDPYHRMFRRALYREARERGLKVVKFVFEPR